LFLRSEKIFKRRPIRQTKIALTDARLGFALSRMIGGIAFSLGLILVVIAGVELFTDNNFMVMAWASRRISSWDLMRNLADHLLREFHWRIGSCGSRLFV
jgi:formate/nitrite transporter FocA (FNT family)